ncbi:hypothetical protein B5E58_10030 [Tyzzerella sp. An114]|uniref:hypothetical protein n=1 Tax=Tyzzerella sp. An114 TaxID=1965545 RepID=UPI000B435F0C|nr:hypothetical protein [Tyzzerella sp. An114]OUQ56983.1 hypothetical protein B5E58_10030 [Tyzzerella sp. An114]
MKKVSKLFCICAFVFFISITGVATVFSVKYDYSFYENRNLAQLPRFSKESFISGEYFEGLGKYLEDQCEAREVLMKINTFVNMKILKRPVVNDIVVKDDILLPFNNFEVVDPLYIENKSKINADNVSAVRDIAESYGGKYYYIAVPCQYAYFEDRYPDYLNNRKEFTDTELVYTKNHMAERHINYIDMGVVFDKMGNPESMWSTTDNHYTMSGAYTLYTTIINAINNTTDFNLKLPTNIRFQNIENPYLGSRNRKLFGMYDTDEKLLYADFGEPLSLSRTNDGRYSSPTVYKMPENKNEFITYDFYMGGDVGETIIKTERPDLPSVLIYGDSFTNPLESLMYYSFNEMRSLDLRHYNDKTLSQYILEYKPDIVICVRDYESMLFDEGNGRAVDRKYDK